MPSIINSDDGVVSGTSGLKSTGGNDGITTFQQNGTERMRIDSSGNVGIGVTPATPLHVRGANNEILRLQSSDATTGSLYLSYVDSAGTEKGYVGYGSSVSNDFIISNALSGDTRFNTNGSERMRIDSSGNVGIGTSSPGNRLHVNSGSTSTAAYIQSNVTAAYVKLGNSVAQDGFIGYEGSGGNNMTFYTASTERARITSGGFFKASNTGTYASSTSSYHELRNSTGGTYIAYMQNTSTDPLGLVIEFSGATPNGTANRFIYMGDATTMRAEFRSNGGLANYSANNVNLASDQRLKKDISPLDTSWDKVKAIEVVNFRYKDCNEGDPLLYGVIAQQVQPIVPELVVVTQKAKEAVEAKEAVLDEEGNVVEPAVVAKEATPEYFGIREQPMYWLAIKALQEAMTRIEALEAQNAAFEARLAALEAK